MSYKENFKIEELLSGLSRIIKINSENSTPVRTKDGELYPYGKGVDDCFKETLKIAEEMGFSTFNCDNYGGHIDFIGTGEENRAPKILGILGHLDVVPAGTDWSKDPYGGEIEDGYLYGRGTTDDKGPLMSCLYAMKALKDSGFKPKNTIRLIIGLDEETGCSGMDYYFKKVKRPDFGFTPDAEFPIINGEKGIIIFDFAKKFSKVTQKGLMLRTITGGTAANAVASECRAVLRNDNLKDPGYDKVKALAETFRKETGYKLNYKGVGKSLEITTTGVASHGATPEKGLNAISIMMKFLGGLYFVNEQAGDFIDFYNKYIGFDLDGEHLNIKMEDEKSGKLVFNVGKIALDQDSVKLTCNVRYPVTKTCDDCFKPMAEILEKYNIGYRIIEDMKPLYIEPDDFLVKTLLDVYKENTGDTDAKPIVIGGGTYAKSTPNVVAFGALFPGDPDLMHQKDEKISVERLSEMTNIYMDAIYKLSI